MHPMIGVFDSGVGGLSVLREIRRELPHADVVYLADQGRAPYGVKTLDEVAAISDQVSRWLMDQGASTITVACNTASAAALIELRARYPDVAFVGMEPAVKPAALTTSTGVIGVLATTATFQGKLFASVVQRHAEGMTVLTRACPEWVELIERGLDDGPEVQDQVEKCLSPLIEGGADTLVLGCTHFPFLTPVIARVAGPQVTIFDPAPAVARQVKRVASLPRGSGQLLMATSGNPLRLERVAKDLAGIETNQPVLACTWNDD
jgi:glutamate racemase